MRHVRNLFAIFFVSVLTMIGCQNSLNPLPQPAVITDNDQIKAACDNLRAHGCDEGCGPGHECKLSDGGAYSCKEYIGNAQTNPTNPVWLNPTCIKNLTGDVCHNVDSCSVQKK